MEINFSPIKNKKKAQNDDISGGTGSDEIYGGTGDDVVSGGAGQDTVSARKNPYLCV